MIDADDPDDPNDQDDPDDPDDHDHDQSPSVLMCGLLLDQWSYQTMIS